MWNVTVGDISVETAKMKIGGHPRGKAVYFDCYDDTIMERYIKDADIVISLLPPGMHAAAAKIALKYNAHVVTASYASQEMMDMHEEAKEKGLTFLNELGADPGIDHMNGMRSIDKIRKKGGWHLHHIVEVWWPLRVSLWMLEIGLHPGPMSGCQYVLCLTEMDCLGS